MLLVSDSLVLHTFVPTLASLSEQLLRDRRQVKKACALHALLPANVRVLSNHVNVAYGSDYTGAKNSRHLNVRLWVETFFGREMFLDVFSRPDLVFFVLLESSVEWRQDGLVQLLHYSNAG